MIDKVCEIDSLFRPILVRVKKGLRELLKEKDVELDHLKPVCKNLELELKEKQIDYKTLENDMRDLERNENECRN